MRFDELASKAGKAAADVGRRAERPSISQVLVARRRAVIARWLASAAVVMSILGVSLLWPGPGARSSPAAGTIRTTTTTASAPGSTTTTLFGEVVAGVIEGGREACPVTLPGARAFTPASDTPDGPPPSYESVWYGTPELWTRLNHQGEIWNNLPIANDGSLSQKTFWWREGYSMSDEPQPDIIVTLEHLNGSAPSVEAGGPGTNGGHPDLGQFMIVGLEIPQSGCWSITAEYRGTTLSYVAWVGNE
jgi:hypothetical protein